MIPDANSEVLSEHKDICDKLARLKDFIGTESWYQLSSEMKTLLMVQSNAMQIYADTLYRRLVIWGMKP